MKKKLFGVALFSGFAFITLAYISRRRKYQ